MADIHSPDQRHRNMAAVHSASTKPELHLRHALWRLGFRYRVNVKDLAGSPDIVLPKYRTVIFVHGCFWHGHKGCKYYTVPKTNTEFWKAKITRNQERDQEIWRQLAAKGWSVIIVWECQLKKGVMDETLARVKAELLTNREVCLRRAKERALLHEQHLEQLRECRRTDALFKKELQLKSKRI